ncbi:MAG: ATP-dependent Clp protease ATP-binding subunit [Clostridiales bacterium]|jgi:ATP-dependent Clp protease ATP-binding subunit ClpC|nr:ATP-dependent Clp protease ATP-binding subunit [Clostridiales bacterium]
MAYDNKFTERAERALQLSNEAAARMGHNYIGSEHLLLGLAREGSGVAAKTLASVNITEEKIVGKIEELVGADYTQTKTRASGMTPRTKRILELGWSEAQRMGHNYIGTEHLLLAILREGDSVALRILTELGVEPPKMYEGIMKFFSADGGAGAKGGAAAKNSVTPTIDQFSRDLTRLAKESRVDPVIGRSKEIDRVVQILSRRTKNNPCLIGEPGVGKTAIAEGLAQKIADGNLPELLKDKRVLSLDLSSMVAGTKYRGEFEERLKKALDEVRKSGNIILFIDELHTLIGAGAAEGAIDAANILKPSLARGEIQVVGATTLDEYRKYIEKDAALERRFQPISVDEPTEAEAVAILKGLRDKYEAHHKVKITDEAVDAAVTLSARYIPDRFLPDKAIDLIDEASSKARLKNFIVPPDMKKMEEKIGKIRNDKESAIRGQDFEKAAGLRDEEKALREKLEKSREKWTAAQQKAAPEIGSEEIAHIVAIWTGIPVQTLAQEESERLLKMEEVLHKRVIGQDEAVTAVAKAIRRGRVGLKDPKRPTGSFIFLGPTGVGKTELSKALAEAIFGDEDAMIRFDMSEYMEKHTVSRLVGSPPGYVGYDEGGQLTEKVRGKPYSVVLFDEIEKAHPDVFNLLLQILEDGILTDAQGRRADFRNTVIIMTSNVGARDLFEKKRLGFADNGGGKTYEDIKSNVMSELKRVFKPEFLNRVDDIIVFQSLSAEEIKKIAVKMLGTLSGRLNAVGIGVTFTDEAAELLAKEGFDPTYGARPLRRAIQSKVEDFLAEQMLEGKIKAGDRVTIGAADGKIMIEEKGISE